MFHRSERLFLRPAWIEDAPAVAAGIAEEAIVRNLARAPWPYTLQSAVDFLSLPQTDDLPRFLLTLPGSDGSQVVGMCGMHFDEDDAVELGYWIGRDWWGRGFATEAARAVIEVARSHGITRVRAGHFVDNPASGKVLRKAGFVPTGKMAKRYSVARGCEVPSVEFELDAAEDRPPFEMKRAA